MCVTLISCDLVPEALPGGPPVLCCSDAMQHYHCVQASYKDEPQLLVASFAGQWCRALCQEDCCLKGWMLPLASAACVTLLQAAFDKLADTNLVVGAMPLRLRSMIKAKGSKGLAGFWH